MRSPFICAAVAATAMLIAAGCHRPGPTTKARADWLHAALARLPADAQVVLAADLDRLRAQPGWATALPTIMRTTKPLLDSFERRAGIDLTRHLRHILIALPAERQADDRFLVLADLDRLDDQRVKEAWTASLGGQATVEIEDHRQVILRGGAWATHAPTSPSLDLGMRGLCERAAAEHAVWFASIVPVEVRRALMKDPRFGDVASMARVLGGLDVRDGLVIDVAAELMTTADATAMVRRLSRYVGQAKLHPDMLVHGLAPILNAVRLSADSATVHARLEIPTAQLAEWAVRFESLASASRTK